MVTLFSTLISTLTGINCTKSDLLDLLAERDDVEIVDFDDNDLTFSQSYK